MTQHFIRGYKPYSPVELAAAAERHRFDGTPKPVALMEKEPLMMTVTDLNKFNTMRSVDRRRLQNKFGERYSQLFPEVPLSFLATAYPGVKRKAIGMRRV